MSVAGPEQLDMLYSKAIDRVWDVWMARVGGGTQQQLV